jgi:ParB-like nuclease family protein
VRAVASPDVVERTVYDVVSDPACIGPAGFLEDGERRRAMEVAIHNGRLYEAYAAVPWDHPVGRVVWVHLDRVQANDWNPNSVANQEMTLLHTSISEDGYTQPVVAIWDPALAKFVIVDGFHRFTTMSRYPDIYATTGGYLPVVVLDKSVEDRMAATVRHNRARGAHSVQGMGSLVFGMLREGATPETVCQKIGLEPEELARLTHITGYSKLYGDVEFSTPVLTTAQVKAKAAYAAEHPDEHVPNDF